MTNDLNSGGHLPLTQPYNVSPWNYDGDESVTSIPSPDIVDWVLIEILKKPDQLSSQPTEIYSRRAGFLLADGSVSDLNGSGYLYVPNVDLEEFHVRVIHRNHLPVISTNTLPSSGGIFTWDFTSGEGQAIGGASAQKQLSAGVWCMIAGDGNASSQIDNRDKNGIWFDQKGTTGYINSDYNMDGYANYLDIVTRWWLNAGQGNSSKKSVLTVCENNGRYFCRNGKAVYFTGSHTWDNFQDIGATFNYQDYLDWIASMHHNFIRLWAWETPYGTDWALDPDNYISPLPYKKVGSQYDITQLNEDYFDRLRQRIKNAQDRGIYVAIMLFEGFSAEHTPYAWSFHPFESGNNINGVSVSRNDVHTNLNPDVVEAQRLYVREVIDIVNYNNLNNVLYEIGNEIPFTAESDQWQNDLIDFIHDYELNTYGVNRPVGKTFQNDGGNNAALFNSPADWISPNSEGGFDCREGDAPVATGEKVIISDTDHFYYLWYSNAEYPVDYVWKSFTGGINAIHMDNWGGGSNMPGRLHGQAISGIYDMVRYNMGWAEELAERINLASATPQPSLSSTGFCLASANEFVVYFPANTSSATVNLSGVSGQFNVEWFDTGNGAWTTGNVISGGNQHVFNSPYGDYSVLYLKKAE